MPSVPATINLAAPPTQNTTPSPAPSRNQKQRVRSGRVDALPGFRRRGSTAANRRAGAARLVRHRRRPPPVPSAFDTEPRSTRRPSLFFFYGAPTWRQRRRDSGPRAGALGGHPAGSGDEAIGGESSGEKNSQARRTGARLAKERVEDGIVRTSVARTQHDGNLARLLATFPTSRVQAATTTWAPSRRRRCRRRDDAAAADDDDGEMAGQHWAPGPPHWSQFSPLKRQCSNRRLLLGMDWKRPARVEDALQLARYIMAVTAACPKGGDDTEPGYQNHLGPASSGRLPHRRVAGKSSTRRGRPAR